MRGAIDLELPAGHAEEQLARVGFEDSLGRIGAVGLGHEVVFLQRRHNADQRLLATQALAHFAEELLHQRLGSSKHRQAKICLPRTQADGRGSSA